MDKERYNLHNHTIYSDGELTPTEVVAFNKKHGYNVIAITDHETTEGLNEAIAAGKRLGVVVIPGVEISTANSHILGLFIDPNNNELQELLRQRQNRESEVAKNTLKLLEQRGYKLTEKMIRATTKSQMLSPSRIALCLVNAGLVEDMNKAKSLIDSLPKIKPTPGHSRSLKDVSEKEAIEIIRRAKGEAIMAHPMSHRRKKRNYFIMPLRALLLKRKGLSGLEVDHPEQTKSERRFIGILSRVLRMQMSGGADFHDPKGSEIHDWNGIKQKKGILKSINKMRKRHP